MFVRVTMDRVLPESLPGCDSDWTSQPFGHSLPDSDELFSNASLS